MLKKILGTIGIILLTPIMLLGILLIVMGFVEKIYSMEFFGIPLFSSSIYCLVLIKIKCFPTAPKDTKPKPKPKSKVKEVKEMGLLDFLKRLINFDKDQAELNARRAELEKQIAEFSREKEEFFKKISDEHYTELQSKVEAAEKKLAKSTDNITKISHLFKAIQNYVAAFHDSDFQQSELQKIEDLVDSIAIDNLMEPTVEIKLHNYDVKELRKLYRQIDSDINSVLTDYEKRYTTKGNLAIYRLMVIALRSELQNVLYTMKFGKFEDAEAQIEEIAAKYILIAADGNKSIAPTITRFVTETKHLFIEAAKVEYEYYLRRERAKEEQKALREQMRQEAEERRRLEEEQRKVEAEESKYTAEISKLQEQLSSADGVKSQALADRIAELEAMLAKVSEKKETIVKLQNGKAGCVYIISNLGAFGDHTFKIGMTRRLNPQDRIDELGDASVPFKFDVHSFIFSDDAAALETAIHHRLNDRRLNKVNLRKEFFNITLDELEALVYELEPSAEFNRTMAAEQYRQSLSMKEVFSDFEEVYDDEPA